ncbi:MAG: class I SAM-dependent methyltransferase [Acidimicrobiales bacterium]
MAEIYDDRYYDAWDWERREQVQAAKERTFGRALRILPLQAGERLLDLGCAHGELAAHAVGLDLGLDVAGIDLNAKAIEIARHRVPGATFFCGELSPEVVGTGWDVVTMFDFLEHVRDPVATLRAVRSVLSPSGRALISTPSTGSPVHRLTGRLWPQYREEHLVLFTPAGLQLALARAGFVLVDRVATTKYTTPAYLFGQLATYSSPRVERAVARLRSTVEAAPFHLIVPLRFGEVTAVAAPSEALP